MDEQTLHSGYSTVPLRRDLIVERGDLVPLAAPIKPGTARHLGIRRPPVARGGLVRSPRRNDNDLIMATLSEGYGYVTPAMIERHGKEFLAKLGGIPARNLHVVPDPRDVLP